jgi:hypothetical protein
MAVQGVLLKLQGLNQDLESMVDMFTRLVKSARMRDNQGDAGSSASGADLSDVLVESLVTKGSAALDKVAALNKALTLGNSDMRLYDKVKGTQHRLHTMTAKHAALFATKDMSPMMELQALLARLEKHYYGSMVPPHESETAVKLEDELEELCLQSLNSILQPRTNCTRTDKPHSLK